MARHQGLRWVAFRVVYAARQRTGLLERRLPARAWDDLSLGDLVGDKALASEEHYLAYRRGSAPCFFFSPQSRGAYRGHFEKWDRGAGEFPAAIARRLLGGELRFFEHTWVSVGYPPDWRRNALTGERVDDNRHWSRIDEFEGGDIKALWEPARFAIAYVLVRAYWRTGDERWPEAFWKLVESWREANPPQVGPHWKCGQEASIRLMAWCFGLYGFLSACATTATRVARLCEMVAASAERIQANLAYAVSQRNNHGVSEATGLWTAGLLFPEMTRAAGWREAGRRVLEQHGRELIDDDGAFAQHSMNYQRVMLHDYLWAIRLGECTGQPLSDELRTKVARAGKFVWQNQDEESGKLPRYGQNDGALVLPLDNCDHQDYRPVVQAVGYLGASIRRLGPGPWDEPLLWLFGPGALDAPVKNVTRQDLQAPQTGYYTIRGTESFAFTRCGAFTHRPSQADLLHVDVWWRGQNVALDPGTFSYNAPAPWNNPFGHTNYHNTVTVDGCDQMDRIGRFLWVPWPKAASTVIWRNEDRTLAYWEGLHAGYARLKAAVSHRRALVLADEDLWIVADRLDSHATHTYRLHWLFEDWPHEWHEQAARLVLQTPRGTYYVQFLCSEPQTTPSLVRADEGSPRGWQSPYYGDRQPALSVDLVCEARAVWYWTILSPVSFKAQIGPLGLTIDTDHAEVRASMALQPARTLLSRLTRSGPTPVSLELP